MNSDELIEKKNQLDNIKSSTIQTSIIASLITIILVIVILHISFKPIQKINENSSNIITTRNEVVAIRESIETSRKELEKQVNKYIDDNYGELSERDEKVDKLLIYFRQQDARLNNIEKALSKF